MKYSIGYYNKQLSAGKKTDYRELAQTDSKIVAMFIRDSYNEAYKKAGLSTEAVIIEK